MPSERSHRISVITVVYNAAALLENTIKSVIGQDIDNLEYIVVDGGSKDGTVDVIRKYESYISKWISEPDKGIYDAMNKGIRLATGEWIIFMNAADTFCHSKVLSTVLADIPAHIAFIYSDFYMSQPYFPEGKARFIADFGRGIILHQSAIYKRSLHEVYGYYNVTKRIIISDYLFFNNVPEEVVMKVDEPISINTGDGVSAAAWSFYQKKCADYIFGRISLPRMIKDISYYKAKLVIRKIFGHSIISRLEKMRFKNTETVKL